MPERIIAEVFPPGEFIKEELEARDWTQTDLAEILGRPVRLVNEIISAKRGISPETAKGLGDAFGTGAQFWMNLEAAYQLSRIDKGDSSVARRAKLYSKAPVKDMIRRNWIGNPESVDVLEKRILDFFEIQSLEENTSFFSQAARNSTSYHEITPSQCAWLYRAKHLAHTVTASNFTDAKRNQVLPQLKALLSNPAEIRHIPPLLAEAGIRFLIVEPLPQTRIDGASFWLDSQFPVVVLSLQYDRIDRFWHVLLHELHHIKNRTSSLDMDIAGERARYNENRPDYEVEADEFAANFLIPPDEFENFMTQARPLYSKRQIQGFASSLGIHPGIVVGQLQLLGEISGAHGRDMLVKIRQTITESALTDGWGNVLPSRSKIRV